MSHALPNGPRSTHFFCGGGGDTWGLSEAGYRPYLAINHDEASIDTHSANFPDTDHLIADIDKLDFRRLPYTEVLWGSPICWESSPAGGRKKHKPLNPAQMALLEYGKVDDSTWERTRATAYDILRAAEIVGYDVVFCENVIEFTDWPLFDWWVQAMTLLGYNHTITCVSSAHVGDDDNPRAPQWRDRLYIVFTRKGIPLPDLEPHPLAACIECGEDVFANQWWKDPKKRKLGKYRQQYLYRSPHEKCRYPVVEPYVVPAITAIDLTHIGGRIGDRKRPIATSTRRRIEVGLDLVTRPLTAAEVAALPPFLVNANHDDIRVYRPDQVPLSVRTTKIGDAMVTPPLLVPAGGTWNDTATSVDEPMRTRMANPKGFEAVVTPEPFLAILRNNATAQSLREPLATLAARGNHHALVVPYYRTGRAKTTAEPLDTLTVRDRFAVVSGQTINVDDCYMRMLQPRESFNGQRFPQSYVLRGNKGQQTAQAGNAVSVNVARWVGEQTLAVLDGRSS